MKITSEELRKFIFNVGDFENSATAFLVSSRYALTVEHAIGEKENIILDNGINEINAKVIYKSSDEGLDIDIAILELEEDININRRISISTYDVKEEDNWTTYGYPSYDNYIGDYLNGIKNKILQVFKLPEEHKHNIKLKYDDSHIGDFSGFSGAPLIVKGRIVGIINTERVQDNRAVRLTALSVDYFKDILKKYDIDTEKDIICDVVNRTGNDMYSKYIYHLNTTNKSILEDISFIKRGISQSNKNLDISIESILYNEEQYIILSEPGGGKTCAIKSLCYDVTRDGNGKIPVVLDLKDYNLNFKNIRVGILNILSQYNPELKIDEINKLINSGRLIILLDGLDEVKQDSYHKCISELKDLLMYNRNSKYIITCRSNRYKNEFESMLTKLEFKELNEIDIRKYLFRDSENIHVQRLDKNIVKIVKNPLLLSIFYNILQSNSGYIPKSRVDLYDKFLQTLIYNWNNKESKHQQISIAMKIELQNIFTYIAYKTFNLNDFDLEFLYESVCEISKIKSNSGELMEYILNLGILEFTNDTVWFKHKTYKEYFAARYIMKVSNDKYTAIEKIINNNDWNEVLIFMAGMFKCYEDQSVYLDLLLSCNLKLYIECVKEKNDLSESLISKNDDELCYIYLSTMIKTYENILDKYLNQIKHLFNPYKFYFNYDDTFLCIKGNLIDKKYLDYKYFLNNDGEKVIICDAELFVKNDLYCTGSQTNFINIELSNLDLDSARYLALKSIKEQLIDILDKRGLFTPQILCERIEYEKIRIGIIDDIKILEEVDKVHKEYPGVKEYHYKGVNIIDLARGIRYLQYNNISIKNNTLPKGDISINKNSYRIWDVYSKERIVERISKFFELYKKSIMYIMENYFQSIKEYLPCYKNMPYRYTVKYYFHKEYLEGRADKHLLGPGGITYFYEPDKENELIPRLIECNEDTFREENINLIYRKYNNRNIISEGITISSTGISEILHEDSLSKFINSKMKREIEYLFDRIK